jgi:hypothetical protein
MHIKELLGHVNIMKTIVYVHLINFDNEEYVCTMCIALKSVQRCLTRALNMLPTAELPSCSESVNKLFFWDF